MKRFALFLSFLLVATLGHAQQAATLPVMDATALKARLSQSTATLTIVNFWATWCGPCIKELPHFDRLAKEYEARGVKLLLVSQDSPLHIDSKVKPFLAKRGLTYETIVMRTENANEWITMIDPNWSGSIPATLLVGADGKFLSFHEGEFTYETLKAWVDQHLPVQP